MTVTRTITVTFTDGHKEIFRGDAVFMEHSSFILDFLTIGVDRSDENGTDSKVTHLDIRNIDKIEDERK